MKRAGRHALLLALLLALPPLPRGRPAGSYCSLDGGRRAHAVRRLAED